MNFRVHSSLWDVTQQAMGHELPSSIVRFNREEITGLLSAMLMATFFATAVHSPKLGKTLKKSCAGWSNILRAAGAKLDG
jgi:hypothetical protein